MAYGHCPVRFIPAPAGNTAYNYRILPTVHPRACGEQFLDHRNHAGRFIPAPAGNRQSFRVPLGSSPRLPAPCLGSSPRLRGTDDGYWRRMSSGKPVHPRACGEQIRHDVSGSSPPCGEQASVRTVHPRACGEQIRKGVSFLGNSPHGSSPRLRGTAVLKHPWLDQCFRFIPAPAGNRALAPSGSSPRLRGTALSNDLRPVRAGSSPRLRGTAPSASRMPADPRAWSFCTLHGKSRFIPAPAGNRDNQYQPMRFIPAPAGTEQEITYVRFIPAPAGNRPMHSPALTVHPRSSGNRTSSRLISGIATVHPRACGEQSVHVPLPLHSVHPRACGEQLTGLGRVV